MRSSYLSDLTSLNGSWIVYCLKLNWGFTSWSISCFRFSCYSRSVIDGTGHTFQPFTWQILIVNLQRTTPCLDWLWSDYFIFKTYTCWTWEEPSWNAFQRLYLFGNILQPITYLGSCSFSYSLALFTFSLILWTLKFLTWAGYFVGLNRWEADCCYDCVELHLFYHTLTCQFRTIEWTCPFSWRIYVMVILGHEECTSTRFSMIFYSSLTMFSLSLMQSLWLILQCFEFFKTGQTFPHLFNPLLKHLDECWNF